MTSYTDDVTYRLESVPGEAKNGESLEKGGALQLIGVLRLQQVTVQVQSFQRLVIRQVTNHVPKVRQAATTGGREGYYGDVCYITGIKSVKPEECRRRKLLPVGTGD